MIFRISALSAALACLLPIFTVQAGEGGDKPDPRIFHSSDIFSLEYVTDPQISPDGRHIIYTRNSMDIMTDHARPNLWIIDADGSNNRPVLSGRQGYSQARWSPDGTRIVYVSAAEGSPQLYLRWMDTGQTALLTNLQEAPRAISWSPDGKTIAFIMHVPKTEPPLATPPAKPDGAEWAAPVKVIDTLIYRADGEGFVEAGYDHVFVIPATGGTPHQLTAGDFDAGGPLSWTPDGKSIVFSSNREADWEYDPVESEVFSINVADGTLTQLTHRKGPDQEPVISPNGRQIAYVGFDDHQQGYQITHLYVMDADGKNAHMIAGDFQREVFTPHWSQNGRELYFLFEDRGIRKLGVTTLDGKVSTVAEGIGGTDVGRPYTGGGYSLSGNDRYAITLAGADFPADVAAGSGRRAPERLTRLNDDVLGYKTLGKMKEVYWKSTFDGREIQGWVITPPNYDPGKKYPLILEIHGGPYAAYGPTFSAEQQLYAAAGYVVLFANPRGSTSYGEEFGNLIHLAYPGNDYDDLMSGVDKIIAEYPIDPDNLFVTGGSGGGVLTAWIVGKTHRFHAAAVAKPVINWTSFALTSDFYNFFYKYWFSGYPWDKHQEYWEHSPLSLVGNVTTPTMLMTGEADHRTPSSEAEQFYQALKLRKVDTVMVRVPDAPHEIATRPSNMIAKADNILAWFAKYRTDLKKKD